MPVAAPVPAPLPVPQTPSQKPAQRAAVQYENGLLTVKASNSSLNQILRAIMKATNLQITGGVADERVYGVYGPSSLRTMLQTLLRGTAVNMLYMPANSEQSARLALTPLAGGSPAPSPSASAADDLLPDGTDTPAQAPALAMQPNPAPVPASPALSAPTPQPNSAGVPTPASPALSQAPYTTPAATATTPAFPPKPHTPEELVQQILQLREAQKKMQEQSVPAATPAQPTKKK